MSRVSKCFHRGVDVESRRDTAGQKPKKTSKMKAGSSYMTGTSGGSRPSAKEGPRLTMNVEFHEDNSGTSKKMRYFLKNKVGARAPRVLVSAPASLGSATGDYS